MLVLIIMCIIIVPSAFMQKLPLRGKNSELTSCRVLIQADQTDREMIIPYLSMEIWRIKAWFQRPRYDLVDGTKPK